MKTSYLTAGINMGNLLRLLSKNKITLRPKYIGRALFLIQSAVWSSIFASVEHLLLKKKIETSPVPVDPIFIIGHWRTGSTFLHQLMNLDPNNAAPTLFQVALPDSFLVSYPYYKPIMKTLVDKTRPMDKVKLGMDEPQEDEYAIYRITDFSPLEKLVFPESTDYFLLHEKTFTLMGEAQNKWEKRLMTFYQKLFYKTGKTIISKNPFNSFRIPTLARLFPGARFIHIVRNPIDVVPSTINMWSIVQRQNALINKEHKPTVEEIVKVYKKMLEIITNDFLKISPGRRTVVKYEDIVADPISQVKKIYLSLSLPFDEPFENALKNFLRENKNYEKNKFSLSEEDKAYICKQLCTFMTIHGYQ